MQIEDVVIVDNETLENVTTTFVVVIIIMNYSMKLMNVFLCVQGYDAMMENLLARETLAQRAVLSILLD
ncbi:hypothetical protein VNO80_27195 [Phaseolus coccineus]|uniref:Uncharacterized protein n=1 Tax=Phaseolus coccineus TaxID=3886 RepID=A0AAN9LGD2_PHACN